MKVLELRIQTVEDGLLSLTERGILTAAVESIATGEVEKTFDDPKLTLQLKIADVTSFDEATLFVRKVVQNASGRLLDANISLGFDPKESSLVGRVTD
jgi:hypothetical protein